jgi:hypothetical protein
MRTDPRIVAELRSMFLNGATPWRLVRHIASRHDGDPNCADLVGPYFAEAFAVTMIALDRGPNPVDLDGPAPPQLDEELLRDMVGRAAVWRATPGDAREPTWFDGLKVSPDDLALIDAIKLESHPALADTWAALPPRAQAAVRQAMVNAQAYHERMKVLARLVERLQQQVVELERHSEEVEA